MLPRTKKKIMGWSAVATAPVFGVFAADTYMEWQQSQDIAAEVRTIDHGSEGLFEMPNEDLFIASYIGFQAINALAGGVVNIDRASPNRNRRR